jgi:hypothetical protein
MDALAVMTPTVMRLRNLLVMSWLRQSGHPKTLAEGFAERLISSDVCSIGLKVKPLLTVCRLENTPAQR